MRRISSRTTFFLKRVFPVIWFGMLAFITVVALDAMTGTNHYQPLVFIWLLIMAILGYLIMKKLIFDLVDEVWDNGDELLVKNSHKVVRVPLSDIVNISYAGYTSPPRVTLSLRQPCRFGKQITFCPQGIHVFPFSSNPVANELRERVGALRMDQ